MTILISFLQKCKANCPFAIRKFLCWLTQISTIIGIWTFVFGVTLSFIEHGKPFQYGHISIHELTHQLPFLPFHFYINLTVVVGSILMVLPRPAWWVIFIGTTPSAFYTILFVYYTLAQRIEPAPFYVYPVFIGWVILQWVLTVHVADRKLR
jgi:hypothetical protein